MQSEILENLIVEVIKPRSKSILVSTWYRPPDSPVNHFADFETMIGALDAENLEYFLLGDINVDFTPTTNSSGKNILIELFDIYGLYQLIEEPTRITEIVFLSELRQQPWENVYHYEDPNVMWATWKDLLMNVIDRPMHHLGPGESAASDPHGLLMN